MVALWMPILVTTIALFFASFLSWMVVKLHDRDWDKMEAEDQLIEKVRELNVPVGNYMFPGVGPSGDMNDPAYQAKYKSGPRGILAVLPEAKMGKNLALTMLFFFVCSCTFGYLASFALDRGQDSLTVFRFVATIALLTFSASIIQHAIWFRNRVVGHVIESIAYSLIAGGIFAAFWPAT
tara:strand:- start:50818 stop:51357 length:540 start_codon:yes stop_codon:yes gene_type:complete